MIDSFSRLSQIALCTFSMSVCIQGSMGVLVASVVLVAVKGAAARLGACVFCCMHALKIGNV